MERETARLLKNTAIWIILVPITGGSIGLTERFFGKPASLIVGASILSGFMYWDFLKRKSAEDTTRQIFELLKANRDNSSIKRYNHSSLSIRSIKTLYGSTKNLYSMIFGTVLYAAKLTNSYLNPSSCL